MKQNQYVNTAVIRLGGKKKSRIRKLSMFLICCLMMSVIVSGCGNKKETKNGETVDTAAGETEAENIVKPQNTADVKKGRFVQKRVDYPEFAVNEYPNPYTLESGDKVQLITFQTVPGEKQGKGQKYRYHLYTQNGAVWDCEELQWLNSPSIKGQLGKLVEYDENKWCLITQDIQMDQKQQEILSMDNYMYRYDGVEKKIEDITPKKWFEEELPEDGMLMQIRFDYLNVDLAGEVIYCCVMMDELHIYDPKTGKNERMDCNSYVDSFCRDENDLYVYDGQKTVEIIDLTTRKVKETLEKEKELDFSRIAMSKDKKLYCISQTGIEVYDAEKRNWSQTLDAANYEFGSSDTYLMGAQILGESDYYITFNVGMEIRLLHIYFDPSKPTKNEKTLTVCSLFQNPVIKDMVTAYQYERDDVDIELKVLLDEDQEAMVQDTIRTMNSELLAGAGADIYVLNGLEADNMIEKGVFVDLNTILKSNGELISSVVDAYKDDNGSLYELPLRFRVPMFVSNSDAATDSWQLTDFIHEFETTGENKYCSNFQPEFLYNYVIDHYGPNWLDGENHLKVEEWKKDLDSIKKLLSTSLHTQEEDPTKLTEEQIDEMVNRICYSDHSRDTGGAQTDIASKNALFSVTYDGSKEEAFFQIGMAAEFGCHYASAGHTFVSGCTIGMNAKGANPEEAADFMNFVCSEKAQTTVKQNGFPINQKSLDRMLRAESKDSENAMGTDDCDGKMYIVYYRDLTQEQIDQYKATICSVNHRIFDDIKVKKLLMTTTMKALTDTYELNDLVHEFENTIALFSEE